MGRSLIADSVASVEDLMREFETVVGRRKLRQMQKTMSSLYAALHLDGGASSDDETLDLSLLARRLRRQLGSEAAECLGQLLLNPGTKRN
jgi:hypothetical protein